MGSHGTGLVVGVEGFLGGEKWPPLAVILSQCL